MEALVVDTSAILAMALFEPLGPACYEAIGRIDQVLISAASFGEALIVGMGKGDDAVGRVLATLAPTIVAVDERQCRLMREAYAKWGKGVHRARLNIFDCFAYALAIERDLPLLYIGDDFSQTDVKSVLPLP